jgi:16S rRNA G966 N2-methylase RsmD
MRITSGIFRGRKLRVPAKHVRPTQDRVREALFSSLQTWVPECRFLDLFAGTGSVGLEALSRGAALVTSVEGHRSTFGLLEKNSRDLTASAQLGEAHRMVQRDVVAFLAPGNRGEPYDIVFADPPYERTLRAEGRNPDRVESMHRRTVPDEGWGNFLLTRLAEGKWVAPGGLFVMEQGEKETIADADGWTLLAERLYGSSLLRVFRRD